MTSFLSIILPALIGLLLLVVIYRFLPARELEHSKPSFVLFPKYKFAIDDPEQLQGVLVSMGFREITPTRYVRGHVLGDFLAKWVQLTVLLDLQAQTARLQSPFVILFDTGDLWMIAQALTEKEI